MDSVEGFTATALVPDDVPMGTATVTLAVPNESVSTTVNVVASAFGLFTNSSGIGQAVAQNFAAGSPGPNNFTHPAHPGDTVTLYGTGLGSATQSQVAVMLGGRPAPLSFAGPTPYLPGTDVINFQIPADLAIPDGCFVAVQVVANGVVSNQASISKAAAGVAACTPPFDLTAAQMTQLDAGQTIPFVKFSIDGLVSSPVNGAKVTLENLIHPLLVRNESFDVEAIQTNEANLATMFQPLLADDVFYSCSLSNGGAVAVINASGNVNLGPELTLTGPGATGYILTSPGQSFYSLSLPTGPPVSSPEQLPPPFFVPGVWQISGPGGQPNPYAGVPNPTLPYTEQITTPPTIQLTNFASMQTIDPTKPLVVTWSPVGYGPGDVVTVTVGPIGVSCRAHASDGFLSIPPSALPILISGQTGGATVPEYLQISAAPQPDQLTRADIPVGGGLATPEIVPGIFTYSFTESLPVALPAYGIQ